MMKKEIQEKSRRLAIKEAVKDEHERFNSILKRGANVYLTTFTGAWRIKFVDGNWWYHTEGNGGFGQSWAGCNDGTWSDLMKQAGLERNQFFKE